MADFENISFEADGVIHEVSIEQKPVIQPTNSPFDEARGIDLGNELHKTQRLIRDYTQFALNSFKNFASADIEEITLTFGVKMSGKAGIPYITEGSAESNLQIQVKCKYPKP